MPSPTDFQEPKGQWTSTGRLYAPVLEHEEICHPTSAHGADHSDCFMQVPRPNAPLPYCVRTRVPGTQLIKANTDAESIIHTLKTCSEPSFHAASACLPATISKPLACSKSIRKVSAYKIMTQPGAAKHGAEGAGHSFPATTLNQTRMDKERPG